MTSDLAMRQAIVERIQPVSDDECLTYRPTPIPAPSVLVLLDSGDPERGFSSGSTLWTFSIMRVLDSYDEQTAQEELSEWADADGPLVLALLDPDEQINDTLSGITRDVRVTSFGSSNDLLTDNGVTQYYRKIRVMIQA